MVEARLGDEPAAAVSDDGEQRGGRDTEQAHGGSMAPGLVDGTGRPVAEPPPPADPADQV